ncbi:uncharacterized protein MONOS_16513 [Monocercomonoides exilis]|uniref:uncharacterized protein n=1 Tax=Monocercomonoides exilis TaxID=2049356 RepID=UPI00355A6A64|nr:hypothetical protein MONOS_16513 [Monocercomonoides exilis]|eukprot:MONOS_16513.1-p1 / transcript=MONOS_16513.1 / gene=MONOS_16513 / organism=Monocercomonoides_exilis_PA203 / gene_product=unspecified product / transcript_product=unspecified product / location=Mono_scaffold01806:466-1160(-) / protein_length=165 / sequence_SO=supercontig / SO=protein_coding / is_pseudo=false
MLFSACRFTELEKISIKDSRFEDEGVYLDTALKTSQTRTEIAVPFLPDMPLICPASSIRDLCTAVLQKQKSKNFCSTPHLSNLSQHRESAVIVGPINEQKSDGSDEEGSQTSNEEDDRVRDQINERTSSDEDSISELIDAYVEETVKMIQMKEVKMKRTRGKKM